MDWLNEIQAKLSGWWFGFFSKLSVRYLIFLHKGRSICINEISLSMQETNIHFMLMHLEKQILQFGLVDMLIEKILFMEFVMYFSGIYFANTEPSTHFQPGNHFSAHRLICDCQIVRKKIQHKSYEKMFSTCLLLGAFFSLSLSLSAILYVNTKFTFAVKKK